MTDPLPRALVAAEQNWKAKVAAARAAEREARRLRRQEKGARSHYEQLLAEHRGQQPLPLVVVRDDTG